MTDVAGGSRSNGKRMRSALRLVMLVFAVLCVVFVVHLLIRDWPATIEALRHARLWWLFPGRGLRHRRHGALGVALGGGHHCRGR